MNPEDRLRSALDARAAAARTSPDALDGVFGKVARHRRNVRVAAVAGTALSVVAVSAVAMASLGVDKGRDIVATSPSVSAPAASHSPAPAPTPTPVPAVSRIAVILGDGRLVEVDAATGAVLDEVTPVKKPEMVFAYSRTRRSVVVGDPRTCGDLYEVSVATGTRRRVASGYVPAFSPDGRYLATAACLDSSEDQRSPVAVFDLTTGTSTTLWPAKRPANWPEGTFHHDTTVAVHALHWQDADTLLVTRSYESTEDTIRVEVGKDTSLVNRPVVTWGVNTLFAKAGKTYGTFFCCMPEWEDPVTFVRVRTAEKFDTVFTVPKGTALFYERVTGALLYTTPAGLWRWDGWDTAKSWSSPVGTRRLIVRGKVSAVLT